MAEAPEGFEHLPRAPFVEHVGPILQGIGDPPGFVRLGVQVKPVHANTLGLMHGGMISTVVDSAMARALVSKLRRRSVTLKMTLEFLDGVHVGDWMVAHARLTASDQTLGFTDCEVRVGESVRAIGTGVFRLLKPLPES